MVNRAMAFLAEIVVLNRRRNSVLPLKAGLQAGASGGAGQPAATILVVVLPQLLPGLTCRKALIEDTDGRLQS
jgi:hypothetical protein